MELKRMKRNYFIYIFIFWYMAKIICSTTFETIGGIPVDTVSSMINYLVLVLLVIQMVFSKLWSKGVRYHCGSIHSFSYYCGRIKKLFSVVGMDVRCSGKRYQF